MVARIFLKKVLPPPVPAAVVPALKLSAAIELTDRLIREPMPPGDHLTLIVPKSMVVEKGDEKEAPREKRSR